MHRYQALVTNGKIQPTIRERIAEAIAAHEGKAIVITIARAIKRRSNNQNRFLHGVFLPAMRQMFADAGENHTAEEIKVIFKQEFGFKMSIAMPDGRFIEVPKSTADYTTLECEQAMDKARAWAASFGYELPFPNEGDL